MKILNEFLNWVNSVNENEILVEGKGHMDHPEDMVILGGLDGYTPLSQTLSIMDNAAKNPKKITIKFDGYPAIVFGAGPDGKFAMVDKHMFNSSNQANRQIHSPEEFEQREAARGERGRTGLVNLVKAMWPALEASYTGPGWYMGDIMFHDVLKDENGVYKFKPNPNGILYEVQVNSKLGKLLTNKVAGIAVHRWLNPEARNTEDNVTWLNDLGKLKNTGNVALMPVSMPVTPKIEINEKIRSKAESARSSEQAIYDFINNAPQTASSFANIFTVYLNNKIVSGNLKNMFNDFWPWAETRLSTQAAKKTMSPKMYQSLTDYLNSNKNIVKQLFKNWIDVYNYKMDILVHINKAAEQSPIKGYLQGGQESQEGFVYGGLKFVNRQGFSAQNLAARQQQPVTEAVDGKKVLVIYPGGFHPFHLGHASVYQHLMQNFPGADVYVAATDSTTERPFQFNDKKFLASVSGVPSNRFVKVKSPYKAPEITQAYDADDTVLIFAASEKDRDRFSFEPKKDGSPSYFQPYTGKDLEPFSQHGYIYITPKLDFKILGKTVDSASKIRMMYANADDEQRQKIARDLYPDDRNLAKVKKVLDKYLATGLAEADNPNYFGGSSMSAIPGTPADLMSKPDPEEVKNYHREMAELKRFMGR